MSRSSLVAASLVAAFAGCAALPPAVTQVRPAMPRLDGLTLGEGVTPAQLNVSPHRFKCRAQGQSGRFQFCWPDSVDSQAAVVMLLDARVGGIMRTFNAGLEDAATQWAVSFMGTPTRRRSTDSHTDLLWDDAEAPFARLLTHLEQFGGQSAFLVMTRTLERYLDEQDDWPETSPGSTRDWDGMTPGRCLAIPFLCPAA